MNNLNSVLIEGNIVGEPLFDTNPRGTALCAFTIRSCRFLKQDADLKQDAGIEKEVGYFDVEAEGELAKSVRRLGGKRRGVRIVGRIKQTRWNDDFGAHSKVVIVAEHIEFRPSLDDTTSSSP